VTTPEFHALHVGKPYSTSRRPWQDGADFNWTSGGHELRIFLGDTSPREVEAIRRGPVEFGLLVEPAGLFLVTRFGGLSFDCSYSWHRMAQATGERGLPPLPGEMSPATRATLFIILIEASNGLVLALRTVTFSPEFSRALHRAIHDQATGPYDRVGHELWAERLTRSTTEELWALCPIRCRGGG
jgi:hypothetical protein